MPDLAQLKDSRLYSEELGIDLSTNDDQQYFRWFLASLLFGGHISETIARHTFEAFCRHRLTAPRDILAAGWDFLVNPIMREGGYVRYDFSKSDQILRDCQKLVDEYDGSVWQVHEASRDAHDLELAPARLLRRRSGHCQHLLAGTEAVLAKGGPRAIAGGCGGGCRPRHRPCAIQTQVAHLRQDRIRADPIAPRTSAADYRVGVTVTCPTPEDSRSHSTRATPIRSMTQALVSRWRVISATEKCERPLAKHSGSRI